MKVGMHTKIVFSGPVADDFLSNYSQDFQKEFSKTKNKWINNDNWHWSKNIFIYKINK